MVLYLTIVIVANILIILFNSLFPIAEPFNNYYIWVAVASVLATIAQILIDGVFAFVLERLPDKWYEFNPNKVNGGVGKREVKFYEFLKIKKWKDKVWELGSLGGFSKKKIADPNSSEYFHKFIIEARKGVAVHIACIIGGALIFFVLPFKYVLRITLPVYLVSNLLNILPTFVLRYNIPKLMAGYIRRKRVEESSLKVSDNAENN